MNDFAYVNDATNVNMWQDVFVTESSEPPATPSGRRAASNVEVLKAMADPLRMNLMYTLSRRTGQGLPVMSVKELAAALGEPKTKLYRHVKQLESVGLIVAVSSRVVSGIVEQRYQAVGPAVFKGDEVSPEERTGPEAEAMVAAALEIFRREYFGVLRSSEESEPDRAAAGPVTGSRCSRSPAGRFRPFGSPPSTISSGR